MSPVYVARATEIAARALGGEMMIMSARDSTLFTFRETSSDVLVTGQAMAGDPDSGDKHFQQVSKSTDGGAPVTISPY